MRPISIMHVVLEPRYSGAEILARDLAQHQMSAGHRASITALRPTQQSFDPEMQKLAQQGCRLAIPAEPLTGWRRAVWIRNAVKFIRPDAIFAHSALPSLYTRLALRFTRRPAVVTVLHSDDDFREDRMRRIEHFLWSRHAAVIGVNSKCIENYRRRVITRIPAQVILNGVHLERFAPLASKHARLRQQLYAPAPGEIIALQVGRICVQKQQHLSVEALIRLQARGISNLRLVFAGPIDEPAYNDKMMDTARCGNVSQRIQVLGSRADVAELLTGADLHLMPSEGEAHSIAALEALAAGPYCVFSGIYAFEPLRTYPGVSLIDDPPSADKLTEALQDVLVAGRWQQRYPRDLSNLSFEQCAAQYMDLARRLARPAS